MDATSQCADRHGVSRSKGATESTTAHQARASSLWRLELQRDILARPEAGRIGVDAGDRPLADVESLAEHSSPRTTRLYDQQQKKLTQGSSPLAMSSIVLLMAMS